MTLLMIVSGAILTAYLGAVVGSRLALRSVRRWLWKFEADTRSKGMALGMVELPGIQGVIREFQRKFR